MFELCLECRKAFNFNADIVPKSAKQRPVPVGKHDAEESSASSSKGDDVTAISPARKKVRLNERSTVGEVGDESEVTLVGEEGGNIKGKEERGGGGGIQGVVEEKGGDGGKEEEGRDRGMEEEGEDGGKEEEGGDGGKEEEGGDGGKEEEGEDGGKEEVGDEGEEDPEESVDSGSEGNSPKEFGAQEKDTSLPNEATEENEATATPVCSACLGLLDDSFIDKLSTDVREELERAAYEHINSFSLSISTPLSLIIRQPATLFYLKGNFEITDELTGPREAYVKETLRHKLYLKLKPKLSHLKSDIESPFQIVLKLDHSHSTEDCRLAAKTWPEAFAGPKKRRGRRWKYKKGQAKNSSGNKSFFNTTKLTNAISGASEADFEKVDFLSAVRPCTHSISFLHTPIFVGGRYCKYSRELPQTPWVVDGVKKAETSVQELIVGHILELVGSSQARLSSSGREDCDVRMLGDGRPFLIELINPKKTTLEPAEVEEVQSRINSSTDLVEVKRLRVMVKADASTLKEGEAEKRKEYRALVWGPEEITQEDLDRLAEMGETVLHQKTPIRVLHRRALATRDRSVYCMRGELVDAHNFYLNLTTQAGTYVKEFVHGDFGRTRPSLRDIMKQDVDIKHLDVCNVLLDWPPQEH